MMMLAWLRSRITNACVRVKVKKRVVTLEHSTHMALGVLSVAVVLIPHHHTLRICSVQQRLRCRMKKGTNTKQWHSPSWACCAPCASR